MKRRSNDNTVYLNAFQTAIEHYWEIKSTVGTNASFNYQSLEQTGTKSFNPKIVRMLPVDYVCDIEISARRVIGSSGLLADHFKKYYIDLEDDSKVNKLPLWQRIDYRVRLKIGKEFHKNKLHNLAYYMRPVWVDIN